MQVLLCNYSESSISLSFNASAKQNQAPTSPQPPPRLLALNFGLSASLERWLTDVRTDRWARIAQMSTTRRPAVNRCRSQTEIADSAASKMQRHRARDAFQTPRCVFIINTPLRLFCSLLLALAPLSKCQIFHHRETTFFRMNSFCFAYEFRSWIDYLAISPNGLGDKGGEVQLEASFF